jgi:hypothetical protein
MPSARPLPIVFAFLIFTICAVAAVQGQTSPPPATPAQATGKPPPMSDIAFYLAHGDTDACGHGCKEWIAAEGKIDPGAAIKESLSRDFLDSLRKQGHLLSTPPLREGEECVLLGFSTTSVLD